LVWLGLAVACGSSGSDGGGAGAAGKAGESGAAGAAGDSGSGGKAGGHAGKGGSAGAGQGGTGGSVAVETWSCAVSLFRDGVCDCGCAIRDPDCGYEGCFAPGCNRPACERCHDEDGAQVQCGAAGAAGSGNECEPGAGPNPVSALCSDAYADETYNFTWVDPQGMTWRVADCRLKSTLTENDLFSFRYQDACAATAQIADVTSLAAAEKHDFVSRLSCEVHRQTGFQISAGGDVYAPVLLGTTATVLTYPTDSCACNSDQYSLGGESVSPGLVQLGFAAHSSCENLGTNPVLGSLYGTVETALTWPGYDYADVGVSPEILYISGDCSACVGVSQSIMRPTSYPYESSTSCGTGLSYHVPQSVLCALPLE